MRRADARPGADDRKSVLALRQRSGGERGAHRAKRLGSRAERLVADDKLPRKPRVVAAKVQDRIVVGLRQRQKQAVAAHEAKGDRRLAERKAFAPLKTANRLDLRFAQIPSGENLLFDWIFGPLYRHYARVQGTGLVHRHALTSSRK